MTGYAVYQKAVVDNGTKVDNTILLLDKVVSNTKRNQNHDNSIDILNYMMSVLDYDVDAEFCNKTTEVYLFCINRLLSHRLKPDKHLLDDVIGVITPLLEGWKSIR